MTPCRDSELLEQPLNVIKFFLWARALAAPAPQLVLDGPRALALHLLGQTNVVRLVSS